LNLLRLALFTLAAVTAFASRAQQPAPPTSHTTDAALTIEVTIPAPIDQVWQAFTTSAGLSTWLAPNCTVDLRPGGDWLAHFPGTTGGGTILAFTPQKELVLSALAPAKFPEVRSTRTHAVFQFASLGPNQTTVSLTQTGWHTGPEWDAAYEYLTAGNAQLLASLHHRFIAGPTDWTK